MFVGFFQPEQGQFGCISCDSLGDYYQDLQGLTFCQACAVSTQRYLGVLSAANKSSCQCKEGIHVLSLDLNWIWIPHVDRTTEAGVVLRVLQPTHEGRRGAQHALSRFAIVIADSFAFCRRARAVCADLKRLPLISACLLQQMCRPQGHVVQVLGALFARVDLMHQRLTATPPSRPLLMILCIRNRRCGATRHHSEI